MGIADATWVSRKGEPYDWTRSVGIVQRRSVRLDLPPDGFLTENGDVLDAVDVSFETYGRLDGEAGNAILVTPPLTADCHVAGFHDSKDNFRSKGWWDEMVGPGKAIDTDRWFVVCASMLGGCSGTTGPVSLKPGADVSYGAEFPDITIGDMVEVQKLLLEKLGVRRLAAVVGGSMGGMQALEWSLRFPDFVERCVCVAAAPSLSAQALAFDIVGRRAILTDPDWTGGAYPAAKVPAKGLSLARMIAHITYLSAEGMAGKFGRKERSEAASERFRTSFEVEKYLDHQGVKFVERFDANAYLHITHAMDRFDLAASYGLDSDDPREKLKSAFARSRCRFLIVALSSDWLFPASESWRIAEALVELGKPVSFCELTSPHGHDGFLLEVDQLDRVLTAFLVPEREGLVPRVLRRTGDRLPATLPDRDVIAAMIPPGSRVLDIGCGDGGLLDHLVRERGCTGEGLDLDLDAMIATMSRGIPALHGDACEALSRMPDGAWDFVVLNQTLQAVDSPPRLLHEILRVGKVAIVGFPNFAVWRCRLAVMFSGRMPKTADLPFEWYETPNLHPFTLADFEDYCRIHRIHIQSIRDLADHWVGRVLLRSGWRNLGADRSIVRISRNPE